MATVMAAELEDVLARRTESLDAAGISLLVRRSTEAVFGRTNVENTIERANLAISLAGAGEGEAAHSVLGHISLFDYPNAAAGVEPAGWGEWLHTHYHCPKASPINSLFLHLFVAKDGFQKGSCEELLRNAFMAVPLLQYVFLCVPEGASLGPALEGHFSAVEGVKREEEEEGDPSPPPPPHPAKLYVTHRHQHFPMLYIRAARVEDADDLTPILQQYSTDINQQYGEHFLAELIESQDDKHKTIVAEVGGVAIGFLSLTTEVDVELLNACYQLEPYHGLRHADQTEEGDLQSVSIGESPQSSLVSSSGNTAAAAAAAAAAASQTLQQQSDTPAAVSTLLAPSSSAVPKPQTSGSTIASSSQQLQNKSVRSVVSRTSQVLNQASAEGLAAGSQTTASQVAGQSQQKITASQSTLPKASVTSISSQISIGAAKNAPVKTTPTVEEQVLPVGGGGSKNARHRKRCVPSGSCSAMAIQLFAVDERYEMRSIDFLPHLFQLFPECDFCLLTQPHALPEFPLLAHFTRVNPRVGATISQELYVLHKCALLHSFSVGILAAPDLPAVEGLVKGLDGSDDVIRDVQWFVEAGRDPLGDGATPLSAVVAKCAGQVVGVAVLRQEEDIDYIRSHFNIEDFVYFNYHSPSEHGHLHHFILSPAFAPHGKHLLKELLRLSGKTCLYYPLPASLSSSSSSSKPHTITSALGHLVPIRARRQVCYPVDGLGVNAPLKSVLEPKPPFALYHTNRKLTLEPKITVNSRVVIVGASDTATALLESLVFSPHLHLSNLSLVSPHTLTEHPPHEAGGGCLPDSCCYGSRQLALLGLKHWVNTVRGTMVAIDRSEKCISVECTDSAGEAAQVYYDKLVICTGTQFCCPQFANANPPLVWAISDSHQSSKFLHWIKTELIPGEGSLVVYGSCLAAYCTLHAAISQGLPPRRAVLVQPRPTSCFNNPVVEQRVHETLQSLGVALHSDLLLEGWEEEGVSVRVVSGDGEKAEVIPCRAVVCLEEKQVDRNAFKAVNDACLVFDGRLVVSTEHCTNDPHILAAGPFTKFSRKYRTDKWTHANFNSKEVGYKLAGALLQELDPTARPADPSERASDLLPLFMQPKATSATLPGGLHYLHVEKPNLGESLETLMQQADYGRQLLTDTERGYFRLHVNQYSKIQTITVLSPSDFPVDNYLCLYDMHEKYLNNLVGRFSEQLITDFFSYFEEPWACAVFHDRFSDFMEEVREHLATQPCKEGSVESLRDRVRDGVEQGPSPQLDHAQLGAEFADSPVKELLQKRLFRFLHYNSYHLPMYAKPDLLS